MLQGPGRRRRDSSVTIEGTKEVDADDLGEHIATREAADLGSFGFVYEATSPSIAYALRRDLGRIERYMRARGFYDAVVRVARVVMDGDKVRVTIEVDEGKPVLVAAIARLRETTPSSRGHACACAGRSAACSRKGARLDEDKLDEAEKAAVKVLASRGHAGAQVERHAEVDLASATAPSHLHRHARPGRLVSAPCNGRARRSFPRRRSAPSSASRRATATRATISTMPARRFSTSACSRRSTIEPDTKDLERRQRRPAHHHVRGHEAPRAPRSAAASSSTR